MAEGVSSENGCGGWVRCLAASVVLAALETIQDFAAHAPDRALERRAAHALYWFRNASRDHPLAYLNCCDLLGLDPAGGLAAVEHFLAGEIFQMDTEEPTIQACTPPTCSGCGRVLSGRRPVWTWGASAALVYCTWCRDGGEFLPAGETWRAATRRERHAPEVRVKVSDLCAPTAPICLRPEEWGRAGAILAEDKPSKR